ncbi:hypothetical protein LTR86_002109 [Recurvomyces mirabilis]|nr:hypothetical protein LTR86_002109 [Recurvomyces mirabilis]
MRCLHHWLYPLRCGADISRVHSGSRFERPWCSWSVRWDQHASTRRHSRIYERESRLTATVSILAHTTSLKHRSVYFAICGGVECFALAFGPLLSGSIAHYSTWRISFWIVVPVSVVAITLLLISVGDLRSSTKSQLSTSDRLKRLDLIGFAINVPMTICFVLGLVWAGTSYPWNNWRIIALFAIAAALFAAFLFAEYKAGEDGMVPYKMLRQRTAGFATVITFCNFASLSVVSYYLPVYFQAIRGANTLSSGLMYLPLAVSMAVTALAGGPLTAFVGYSNPGLISGGVLMSVGAGLITTLEPNTSAAKWITFQIIYGIGVGLAFQPPYIAVQAALPENEVPKALVLLSFSQQLGGIVILTVAQNVFLTGLVHHLSTIVPGVDSRTLLNSGALGLINAVPPPLREEAIVIYNNAIRDVLYIALGLACLVAVCSIGVEWKPVKKAKDKGSS